LYGGKKKEEEDISTSENLLTTKVISLCKRGDIERGFQKASPLPLFVTHAVPLPGRGEKDYLLAGRALHCLTIRARTLFGKKKEEKTRPFDGVGGQSFCVKEKKGEERIV